MQVTIIGGGSYQWSPELITDLLGRPSPPVHLVLEESIPPRSRRWSPSPAR